MNHYKLHIKRIIRSAFLVFSGILAACSGSDLKQPESVPHRHTLIVKPGAAPQRVDDYAGSIQCKQCHFAIFTGWAASSHARKRDLQIVEKPPHFGSCRRCHTTGNVESGVGCEACHGPQSRHIRNPNATSQEDCVICEVQKQCIQCHNRSIDPDFHALEDWKKVSHGKNM